MMNFSRSGVKDLLIPFVDTRVTNLAPELENKPVFIISAASGGGHISAGKAIDAAFERVGLGDVRASLEVLEKSSELYQYVYNHGFLKLVEKFPRVYGKIFHWTDHASLDESYLLAISHKLNTQRFRRILKAADPKVIVSTHFLPAQEIIDLRQQEKLTSKLAVVVTDHVVHAQWVGRADMYFVANESCKKTLVSNGVDPEKIKVTGIPINTKFGEQLDRAESREKLGLSAELPFILFTGGGHGVGGVGNAVKKLFEELKSPAQIAVMCGRGEALFQDLMEYKARLSPESQSRLMPFGFRTDMDVFMSAADIMIGKPGGLTTSEAMAKGLPFLMVNAMQGQEEGNAEFVQCNGAGVWIKTPSYLPDVIDRLFHSPDELLIMRRNALRIGRPNAADDVRDAVLELMKEVSS
jgi:processive 1,2-diacylglycerol beta-glucosyltransferase